MNFAAVFVVAALAASAYADDAATATVAPAVVVGAPSVAPVVVDTSFVAVSTSTYNLGNDVTLQGTTCNKAIDCRPGQRCQMPDHWQYPQIWPPCSHTGACVCIDNYVQVSNGSCVARVTLTLKQRCNNEVWEILRVETRCQNGIVICNDPVYVERNNMCVLAPVPTYAPVPIVVPIVPVIPVVRCGTVSWRDACDGTKSCCDVSRGLSCQQRGPTTQYNQCLCADRYHVFDQQKGFCRPRIYGDLCTESEDCNSGLISNTGFECRYGRCRCSVGYEPYDNLFFNHTSRTTYTRRICVNHMAVTWAPTGTACTVHPHQYADQASTRVCHSRAFCHLCYSQRINYNGQLDSANSAIAGTTWTAGTLNNDVIWDASYGASGNVSVSTSTSTVTTSYVAVTGVCREFTCGNDGECGFQGQCNRFNGIVDPPCERGVCDCTNGNGFWKDRFSRCAPMRQLWLGDRCIASSNGLHPWYINNENWDDDKECVGTPMTGGYAGYSWGIIKCKHPLIEDKDGNCVRNDDKNGILIERIGYNQACDEQDFRIPRRVCDVSKGLVCLNKVCTCASTSSCSGSYAGCQARSTSGSLFWDGNTCRARSYGDQCRGDADCCGGACINGVCGCPNNLRAVGINTATINNNEETSADITTTQFCFRNVSIVGKGQECHLDPASWNCGDLRYGWNTLNYMPALVCDRGLVCMRCPADYTQDDETHGTCRSISQPKIPDGSCSQGDLTQSTIYGGNAYGNTYIGGIRRNSASSIRVDALFAALLLAIAKLF